MLGLLNSWPTLVAITIPVFGWIVNEFFKRSDQRRHYKRERYAALLTSLSGFYQSEPAADAKLRKQEFINQLALCWLYCPDSVIRKGYAFLDTVNDQLPRRSDDDKEGALGDLVEELRRDLFPRDMLHRNQTRLTGSDFRHFRSN